MSKRPGGTGALSGIMNKKQKSDLKTANDNALRSQQNQARNPFLSRPLPKPEDVRMFSIFIVLSLVLFISFFKSKIGTFKILHLTPYANIHLCFLSFYK